jgi:sugar phosphate permease
MKCPGDYVSAEVGGAEKRDRAVTVSLVILCQGLQIPAFAAIGLFLPKIRADLGLSFTEAGSLSAAFTLMYALMQIPAGHWSDRFGPKRMIFIGLVGTGILTLAFGLVDAYWQALSNQAASGFFSALFFIPGMMYVASWFAPERRATAIGLYMAGFFMAGALLSIGGPFFVTGFGWRTLFVSLAAVGLVASLPYLRLAKEHSQAVAAEKVGLLEPFKLLRHPVMWILGLMQFIRLGVFLGLLFWLPTFLEEDRGQTLQLVGLVIALRWVLMAPSNFLGSHMADRLRNPPLVIGASFLMLAVTTLLFAGVKDIPLLILVIAINGMFVQAYVGPLFAVAIDTLGVRAAGLASGFSNFCASLGAFSFVYAFGALKDATGSFDISFYALAGCCFAGTLLALLLSRMRRMQTALRPV